MTSASTIPPLTGTITVDAPIDQTFRTFTASFGSWWPAQYHIGQADMATAILEPREGGRWYEQGVDGSECDWGRVLAWEPPHRLVVTGHGGGPEKRRNGARDLHLTMAGAPTDTALAEARVGAHSRSMAGLSGPWAGGRGPHPELTGAEPPTEPTCPQGAVPA
jgi:uncharacterized protein YndB with AHSA1/START domain